MVAEYLLQTFDSSRRRRPSEGAAKDPGGAPRIPKGEEEGPYHPSPSTPRPQDSLALGAITHFPVPLVQLLAGYSGYGELNTPPRPFFLFEWANKHSQSPIPPIPGKRFAKGEKNAFAGAMWPAIPLKAYTSPPRLPFTNLRVNLEALRRM